MRRLTLLPILLLLLPPVPVRAADGNRLVYLDETGISVNEPVTVVAGIILDADKHWMLVDDYIRALMILPELNSRRMLLHSLPNASICDAVTNTGRVKAKPPLSIHSIP